MAAFAVSHPQRVQLPLKPAISHSQKCCTCNLRRRIIVNSEELELSLRTEFENYLKEVFGEMRQEIAQLQERVEADLEKQKSQLNEAFTNALNRFGTEAELDVSFKETVIEHLRLAKDEGAKITATAIAQAEELEREA